MLKINFPKNKYKTIYADPPWPEQGGGKIKRGADRHYRGLTEHCLFATTKKRLPYKMDGDKRCQGVTGFCEPKTIHSRKPVKMREMIEAVSYAPRIELFAREPHDGWDVWGNEVK